MNSHFGSQRTTTSLLRDTLLKDPQSRTLPRSTKSPKQFSVNKCRVDCLFWWLSNSRKVMAANDWIMVFGSIVSIDEETPIGVQKHGTHAQIPWYTARSTLYADKVRWCECWGGGILFTESFPWWDSIIKTVVVVCWWWRVCSRMWLCTLGWWSLDEIVCVILRVRAKAKEFKNAPTGQESLVPSLSRLL